jgi:phosphoribosyl 1,2-cyclic phosphodiesterase
VEVVGRDGTLLVLDAGTGIRRLGAAIGPSVRRIDVLLTHLHLDHLQGLGFFAPLRRRDVEVHIWGPASTTLPLAARLGRYLSPPLFPVRLRDLECKPVLHEVPGRFEIGPFAITSQLVCHPGPTVGYRIDATEGSLAYLPDHEPALGTGAFPKSPRWTSGYDLAAGADVLIHDAQYTLSEYAERVGWGHSALPHVLAFAALVGVRRLVPFHHDPTRSDDALDRTFAELLAEAQPPFAVTPAAEGESLTIGD